MGRIAILNTGGTWSKEYNPLNGDLFVPTHCEALTPLVRMLSPNHEITVEGIIFKDSLEMTPLDRHDIAAWVIGCESEHIIIFHGTDTMDQTAQFLDQTLKQEGIEKHIVLTGSMQPLIVNPLETALHLGQAVAFLSLNSRQGVFIGMHGLILPFDEIEKNREKGFFRKKLIGN